MNRISQASSGPERNEMNCLDLPFKEGELLILSKIENNTITDVFLCGYLAGPIREQQPIRLSMMEGVASSATGTSLVQKVWSDDDFFVETTNSTYRVRKLSSELCLPGYIAEERFYSAYFEGRGEVVDKSTLDLQQQVIQQLSTLLSDFPDSVSAEHYNPILSQLVQSGSPRMQLVLWLSDLSASLPCTRDQLEGLVNRLQNIQMAQTMATNEKIRVENVERVEGENRNPQLPVLNLTEYEKLLSCGDATFVGYLQTPDQKLYVDIRVNRGVGTTNSHTGCTIFTNGISNASSYDIVDPEQIEQFVVCLDIPTAMLHAHRAEVQGEYLISEASEETSENERNDNEMVSIPFGSAARADHLASAKADTMHILVVNFLNDGGSLTKINRLIHVAGTLLGAYQNENLPENNEEVLNFCKQFLEEQNFCFNELYKSSVGQSLMKKDQFTSIERHFLTEFLRQQYLITQGGIADEVSNNNAGHEFQAGWSACYEKLGFLAQNLESSLRIRKPLYKKAISDAQKIEALKRVLPDDFQVKRSGVLGHITYSDSGIRFTHTDPLVRIQFLECIDDWHEAWMANQIESVTEDSSP